MEIDEILQDADIDKGCMYKHIVRGECGGKLSALQLELWIMRQCRGHKVNEMLNTGRGPSAAPKFFKKSVLDKHG